MVDATTKAGKAKADAFLSWLLATDANGNKNAMARRLGIMYIIFNKRIWRAYGDPGWGSYSGTNPHTDHIHISLSYDGSTGRTSFWNGKPLADAVRERLAHNFCAAGADRPNALRPGLSHSGCLH